MTMCEECREIATEINGYVADARSVLDQGHDDRLRAAEALQKGERNAHMMEEFFAAAPRLRRALTREWFRR